MKLKSQCLRHRRYPNKQIADYQLSIANEKHKIKLVRSYQCRYCLGYHLTSKPDYSKNEKI